MPQMMPINWMLFFLIFIFTFIIFNIMNYFIYNHNFKFFNNKISQNKNFTYWKW